MMFTADAVDHECQQLTVAVIASGRFNIAEGDDG